jgi:hypothetical protein
MTKRLAGVTLLENDSLFSGASALGFGVWTVYALRRLEGGFGFGFCADCCVGTKKRFGDGVYVGIV